MDTKLIWISIVTVLLLPLSSSQRTDLSLWKGEEAKLLCNPPWKEDVRVEWLSKASGQRSFSRLQVGDSSKYSLTASVGTSSCGESECYNCAESGEGKCSVTLSIADLKVQDSGEYKCKVTNVPGGRTRERFFKLKVKDYLSCRHDSNCFNIGPCVFGKCVPKALSSKPKTMKLSSPNNSTAEPKPVKFSMMVLGILLGLVVQKVWIK